MNPQTMEFEPETTETPRPPDWKRFTVGDPVMVNGVPMTIRKITKKDLLLRPVK